MTSITEQFVSELVEAWNSHDIERVVSLYAQNYEGMDVSHLDAYHGPDGARQMVEQYLHAFPDLHLASEEAVAQDSHVAFRWTAMGTHKGRVMNIPPTGRRVSVRGMTMLTLEGGKVARGYTVWDVAGLLREIRLLPEL